MGIGALGGAIQTVGAVSGVSLTSAAFAGAFSCLSYLFGEGQKTELVFKLLFCAFAVIGAAFSAKFRRIG